MIAVMVLMATGRKVSPTDPSVGPTPRRLVLDRLERGDEVVALSRDRARAARVLGADETELSVIEGDPSRAGSWPESLDGCEAVVHLAGAPIATKRWTAAYKALLVESRLESTRGGGAAAAAKEASSSASRAGAGGSAAAAGATRTATASPRTSMVQPERNTRLTPILPRILECPDVIGGSRVPLNTRPPHVDRGWRGPYAGRPFRAR